MTLMRHHCKTGLTPVVWWDERTREPYRRAFTLVEILTVIAIIGILSAMTLAVYNTSVNSAKKTEARTEIKNLEIAIGDYEREYGHYPVSSQVGQSGWTNITYGGIFLNAAGMQWPSTPLPANYEPSNSEVIAILMDMTNFPGAGPTVDANHVKNSRMQNFLDGVKLVSDNTSPGVGTDLNYRDPWGNPYIISIDLNADNKCEDAFYGSSSVSTGGLNGLIAQSDGNYAFHGNVMVWSMGPYGPFNHSHSSFSAAALANAAPNKHHILSWQ
jgi:prepilin-type N-terminal cleavage/methylation domain-containing protein